MITERTVVNKAHKGQAFMEQVFQSEDKQLNARKHHKMINALKK